MPLSMAGFVSSSSRERHLTWKTCASRSLEWFIFHLLFSFHGRGPGVAIAHSWHACSIWGRWLPFLRPRALVFQATTKVPGGTQRELSGVRGKNCPSPNPLVSSIRTLMRFQTHLYIYQDTD